MPPQEKKPVNWRGWTIGGLIALVLIVCLQNSQQVSFEFLFARFDAPLIVVLAVFTLVGVLIGWAAPVLIRHRRSEREQAKALKPKS